MRGKCNCDDNAVMESFFHTLKTEHVYQHKFCTRDEAKRSIFEYIEVFYNRKRAHSFLGHLSPEESERKWNRQAI
jgi:putative transposase